MENFKNEFCSELIRVGFSPDQAVRALSALAITLHGYTVTPKETNIAIYNGTELTARLIKLFVDCKRVENCSPGYCKNMEIMLPKLFEYAGKGPKEISSFDIRGFLAYWQIERGVQGSTLEKYRQDINCFFTWLQGEEYITKNPCSTIGQIKSEIKPVKPLSQLELEEIRSGLADLREHAVIEVFYSTGCRASELADIKLTDLDLENGTVQLFGKGKKYRDGYLNARAIVAIKKYLADRKYDSEYLICSTKAPHGKLSYAAIRRIICLVEERVKGKVGKHLHPHLFRHTTATTALRNGLEVDKVQKLLGHASINTTMRYAKTDVSQLKSDHEKHVI